MYEKPVFLTREGRAKLEAELKVLREVRRPEIAERIKTAKEFSDADDNSEFEEAKNEQAFIEGRILTLENMIANAVMIENNHDHDLVRLGSKVSVADSEGEKEEYTIVGTAEVDPRHGKISNESPVGRALLGRKIGDRVQVVVPAGVIEYEIIDID
jgi:transcription elongation factor GreA